MNHFDCSVTQTGARLVKLEFEQPPTGLFRIEKYDPRQVCFVLGEDGRSLESRIQGAFLMLSFQPLASGTTEGDILAALEQLAREAVPHGTPPMLIVVRVQDGALLLRGLAVLSGQSLTGDPDLNRLMNDYGTRCRIPSFSY